MVVSTKRDSDQKDKDSIQLIQDALAPLGYTFTQKLGEGSYANVYLVKWKTAEGSIPMACKILKLDRVARDERSINYITRELFVNLNVCHPDIIHTFSVFQMNQNFMILMRSVVQSTQMSVANTYMSTDCARKLSCPSFNFPIERLKQFALQERRIQQCD